MPSVKIVIDAKPAPQKRPRFCVRGKHVMAYDPDKNRKVFAKYLMAEQFSGRLECPIELDITFFMPIPKSSSKKQRNLMLANECKHQKLGDLDNLAKGCLDSMNDVVFADDKQVWKMQLEKRYSERPRTEISVHWEEEDPKLAF